MDWLADDYSFMSRAIQLARKGLYTTHPNPRVGCILVKDGRIIAEGWHVKTGEPHAEVNALNNTKSDPRGASCYLTLEPCSHTGRTPPCTDALLKAGIAKLIVAMEDPNPSVSGRGLEKIRQTGIPVVIGLLQSQARELNPGFIKRMSKNRPYVRCKLAMSLDGRTAMVNGESKWITSEAARLDVQRLRAQSSVVMTGVNTVLTDDPGLNVRNVDTSGRQPLRVIIDPQLRFPREAKMLSLAGRNILFTGVDDPILAMQLQDAGAEVVTLNQQRQKFLDAVLTYLAEKEEVNEILLECGPRLAGSMLLAGLIDELILYQAAILMGDNAMGLFHLPEIRSMADKVELEVLDSRYIGKDVRTILQVKSGK